MDGPLPADSLFYLAARGDYDLVVAMYHDQGHGPVKAMGLEHGVNVTAGLPIVRTSVDHGTAFDIAGTGKADERSMIEALRQAAALAPKNLDQGRASARQRIPLLRVVAVQERDALPVAQGPQPFMDSVICAAS